MNCNHKQEYLLLIQRSKEWNKKLKLEIARLGQLFTDKVPEEDMWTLRYIFDQCDQVSNEMRIHFNTYTRPNLSPEELVSFDASFYRVQQENQAFRDTII